MLELIYKAWIENAQWVTDDVIKNYMSNEAIGLWQNNMITGQLLSSLENIGTDVVWVGKVT